MKQLQIRLIGTVDEFKKLVELLVESKPDHHPLYNMAQEIEDQLHPHADRQWDYVNLEDLVL